MIAFIVLILIWVYSPVWAAILFTISLMIFIICVEIMIGRMPTVKGMWEMRKWPKYKKTLFWFETFIIAGVG